MCWTVRHERSSDAERARRDPAATLPGKSRTITVEPVEVPVPDTPPEPAPAPREPAEPAEPRTPQREEEPVPTP
jgi:hypothetical protein